MANVKRAYSKKTDFFFRFRRFVPSMFCWFSHEASMFHYDSDKLIFNRAPRTLQPVLGRRRRRRKRRRRLIRAIYTLYGQLQSARGL